MIKDKLVKVIATTMYTFRVSFGYHSGKSYNEMRETLSFFDALIGSKVLRRQSLTYCLQQEVIR